MQEKVGGGDVRIGYTVKEGGSGGDYVREDKQVEVGRNFRGGQDEGYGIEQLLVGMQRVLRWELWLEVQRRWSFEMVGLRLQRIQIDGFVVLVIVGFFGGIERIRGRS